MPRLPGDVGLKVFSPKAAYLSKDVSAAIASSSAACDVCVLPSSFCAFL